MCSLLHFPLYYGVMKESVEERGFLNRMKHRVLMCLRQYFDF